MKRAALTLSVSLALVACGGDAPDDTEPVRDTGTAADTASTAETSGEDTSGEDTAVEETGEDTAPMDAGKLTCMGSEAEPNDTRVTAAKLPAIDDCDGSGGTFRGVVGGPADADWWTYAGEDTSWCRVNVTASTRSGVRLCVVAFCKNGATAFKSCKKGLKTAGVGGVDGCCAGPGGAADVELEHSCTLAGPSDSADVWMRVDDPSASACKSYSVSYHF